MKNGGICSRLLISGAALVVFITAGCDGVRRLFGECSPTIANYSVDINDWITEYNANPIAFDKKYKNGCVAVVGAPIEFSTTEGYSITLSQYQNWSSRPERYFFNPRGIKVLANFTERDAQELESLRVKGALIKVAGRLTGILDEVSLVLSDAKLDHAFIAENAERIDAERQQLAEAEAEQKRAERVSSKEQMLSQIAKLIPVYERECRERTERAKLPPDYETHTNIPDPENLKIICTNLENLRKMESLWERYNPDIECSFLTVNYMADIHYPGNECQVGTDEAGIENVDL